MGRALHIPDFVRDLKGEAAYAVLARAEELERKGKKIVHMEIGQPDFKTPAPIVKAALESLKRGDHGYAPTLGIRELREAIAKRESKKRGVDVSWQRVAVMPSGKTAIFIAMAATLEAGDEVVYPDPGFPTYGNVSHYLRCDGKPLPIVESRDFSFDREAFTHLISPKTRMIILNSPSNPTGGIIPTEDLGFVAEHAKKNGAWILSDEIYDELSFDEERVASIWDIAEVREQTIVLNSFSKTFAMAGWRLGYMIVPEPMIPIIDALSVNIFACAATFTQHAGILASSLYDEVAHMRSQYLERREYLIEALNKIEGVSCRMPKGAFYAFPNVSSFGKSSEKIAEKLLVDFGVAVLPGTAFGAFGEGYLRLSYATSMENIREGVRRIAEGLASLRT